MMNPIRGVIVSLCVAAFASAGPAPMTPDSVENLFSSNPAVSLAAEKALGVQRAETIASLIRLFREHKADSRRFHALEPAIRILGEWRAVEACGLLVEHLTFPRIDTSAMPLAAQMAYRSGGRRAGPGFYEKLTLFPAAKALTQIGLPSVEPVMNRFMFMTPMDLDEAHVCIVVVARILGEEQTVALLRRRLDDTKDPIRRQIIEIELKLLEEQAQKKRE